MSKEFLQAIKTRRTHYGLSNQITLSQDTVNKIVEEALLHTPSAFHSQSARVVVLWEQQHLQLWQIVEDSLAPLVPADSFPATKEKISSFAQGVGTILFFEDKKVVEHLQAQFPAYSDNFPIWAQQANGMLQSTIWTALSLEGLGASVQHYNPLIDQGVKGRWQLPESWQLVAQMPFGTPTGEVSPKEFQPIAERLKIFN